MDALAWALIITSVAGIGGTGLGGIISAFIKKDSKKTVSLLLSFAGGIMLSVVCFDLIDDALFYNGYDNVSMNTLLLTIMGIVAGFLIIAFMNWVIDRDTDHEIKHIDKNHPKTADDLDELIHSNHYEEHKKKHSELFLAGVIMAFAIALHNIPEGMVIGASYVGADTSTFFSGSGFILAIIIGFHNIPEGMAVAVPLIAGGMGKFKAILITALSGAPTVIGALLGYQLGTMGETWHILSLGFASGAMIYVVFGELLPESILMFRSKLPAFAVTFGILLGLVIIFI